MRTFDGAQTAGVLDPSLGQRRVSRVSHIGIRAFQARVFENGNLKITRAQSPILNMVSEIARNFSDAAAEHRVGQALDQRNVTFGAGSVFDCKIDLSWQ